MREQNELFCTFSGTNFISAGQGAKVCKDLLRFAKGRKGENWSWELAKTERFSLSNVEALDN